MAIEADGRRVALLARPGLARERLSSVLQEAGANCVIAADPTQLKPEDLLQVQPQVVLVALDPLTEEALDQFDEVLGDRSVEVIYEEADHAASREGWDAARWQRHLVAKLQGHSNVLPPSGGARSADASSTAPSAVDVPEASGVDATALLESSDADATTAARDSTERSDATDTSDTPDPVIAPTAANPFDPVSAELEDLGADFDFETCALPLDELTFPEVSTGEEHEAPASPEFQPLSDLDFADPGPPHSPSSAPSDSGFDAFEFTLDTDTDTDTATEPTDRPGTGGVFDHFEALDDFNSLDDPASDTAVPPAAEEEASDNASFAGLSLQEDAQELREMETPESRDNFRRDLNDLEQRISSMSLVDDTPRRGPERACGAVLILGGLGGPDAVRQLLGAVPVGFTRPVLVQQRLEGGRYDRLVTQLQRATKLTVMLAEPAQTAKPGTVYILPDTVGVIASGDGIGFSADASDTVMAALPSSDSAILLLSGSDPAMVDAALVHSLAGALVLGQSAEGCYDAAASGALAARGGDVAAPAALALRLSARWSNPGISNVQ